MYNLFLLACSCLLSVGVPFVLAQPGSAAGEDAESVRAAQSLLESGDPVQINKAIKSVVRLGPRAAATVPTLVELLSDKRLVYESAPIPNGPPIQMRAAEGLAAIGKPAVQPLMDRLDESIDDEVRLLIVKTLGEIGPAAYSAGELLLKCAASDDLHMRYYAVDAFAKVSPANRSLVPKLVHFLDDEDSDVKSVAVQALGRIGAQGAPAIPKLVAMLDSDDCRTEWYTSDSAGVVPLRIDVANCLAKIGVRDEQAVAKLTSLLKHKDPFVRIAAAHAHCRLSEDVNTGLGILAGSLNDRSHGHRVVYEAVRALGELGKLARPLAQQLVDLLRDKEVLVRCAAVEAVASVRPSEFFDLLVRYSQNDNVAVREATFESVANLISRDSSINKPAIVELLMRGLDDESWGVRFWAMAGLGHLGEDARTAVPRLKEMAASQNEWNREAAMDAIDRIAGHK